MSYTVGLVGERTYQPAIASCRAGQRVHVVHELGNPYDEDALAVLTDAEAKIGYIPRDSWLHRAVHVEGKGCKAAIKSIAGEAGLCGVVIEVELNSSGVECCDYE